MRMIETHVDLRSKMKNFHAHFCRHKLKNEEKRAKKINDARFPFISKISYFRVKLDQSLD